MNKNFTRLLIGSGESSPEIRYLTGISTPDDFICFETPDGVTALMSKLEISRARSCAKPGVAEKASAELTEKLPSLRIVGTHDGYFESDAEIIKDITEKSPDLLAVCLGSPRQEIWAHENKEKLAGVGAVMCLGGALDVWSGNIKRAPMLFRKMRLEWLWRMLCEPKRMKNLPLMIKFRLLTRKSRQKG